MICIFGCKDTKTVRHIVTHYRKAVSGSAAGCWEYEKRMARIKKWYQLYHVKMLNLLSPTFYKCGRIKNI